MWKIHQQYALESCNHSNFITWILYRQRPTGKTICIAFFNNTFFGLFWSKFQLLKNAFLNDCNTSKVRTQDYLISLDPPSPPHFATPLEGNFIKPSEQIAKIKCIAKFFLAHDASLKFLDSRSWGFWIPVQCCMPTELAQYLYTFSKNDVISSAWKHYFALRLGLGLKLKLGFELKLGIGLGLGLAEMRF